jgi:hypothetical protein
LDFWFGLAFGANAKMLNFFASVSDSNLCKSKGNALGDRLFSPEVHFNISCLTLAFTASGQFGFR